MREDIYYCMCCGKFKWSKDNSRVSEKYCMECGKTGIKKSIRVIRKEEFGLYCEICYKRLVSDGTIVEISENEQKEIDMYIEQRKEFFEHWGM